MGKHDPFEVFRDRLTNLRRIYFPRCGLGDNLLERCFRFEYLNPLLYVAKLTRRDINENERTKFEDLVNSNIDSGNCLARSVIVFS